MAEVTKIEWADSTLNLWFGCTKVSPACDYCYAESWAKRSGLVQWGPHAPRVQAKHWREQLAAMSRLALAAGRPWFVFVNSLSDFFDNAAADAWRAEAFAAFHEHPHVTFLLITKRIGNAEAMIAAAGGLPPNCAVLITVIDQPEADRDVPRLLVLKARLKPAFVGVSIEPMLGPIDLTRVNTLRFRGAELLNALTGELRGMFGDPCVTQLPALDWVIVGYESGPNARAGHPDWARDLLGQCVETQTAFLFKQWGEHREFDTGSSEIDEVEVETEEAESIVCLAIRPSWIARDGRRFTRARDIPPDVPARLMERVGKKAAGRLLDGVTHDARPELANG